MTTDVRNQDVMSSGVMGKRLHVNSSLLLFDERERELCLFLFGYSEFFLFYKSRILFPPLTQKEKKSMY